MASLTQWTWVQASSERWWRTGKPGMLQSMGLQRVRHDWVIEQQQQSRGMEEKLEGWYWHIYTIDTMYKIYESWTIKKAECKRIDAFELWCWIKRLRVPWTARRSNQLILKEINLDYSLERLMPKLILQYFGHLMWRTDSLEKTLMLEKIEGRRRRDNRGWDGWMASPTQWTWVCTSSRSWWWTGKPDVLQSMGSQRVRHDWAN